MMQDSLPIIANSKSMGQADAPRAAAACTAFRRFAATGAWIDCIIMSALTLAV